MRISCLVLTGLVVLCSCSQKLDTFPLQFNFGGETSGFISVLPQKGDQQHEDLIFHVSGPSIQQINRADRSFFTSEGPFYFSVKLEEGNYRIKVTLGDPEGTSNTTIKAESRRLMVYDHSTKEGQTEELSFIVNLRSARINENDSIRLKAREFDYLNWDSLLTLEFGGTRPCIQSVTIEKADVPTVFLTGNSTVVDQDREPWASWGQMFPVFFKPEIAVANYAESGETLKAFIREGRLKKIETRIQPGDYLFMEFAHNDQKPGGNHVEPFTSYQEHLMKFVEVARSHDATPVLVTSTNRRKFDEEGKIVNTLEDYPDAMRQLAERENITLIDLNNMSKTFYEALGVEGSKNAFVHYEANTFPWQEEALADNTHFSTYGAFQLARCVVQGVQKSSLSLKNHLKEDIKTYDPANPDPISQWKWPVSVFGTSSKPEGY